MNGDHCERTQCHEINAHVHLSHDVSKCEPTQCHQINVCKSKCEPTQCHQINVNVNQPNVIRPLVNFFVVVNDLSICKQ